MLGVRVDLDVGRDRRFLSQAVAENVLAGISLRVVAVRDDVDAGRTDREDRNLEAFPLLPCQGICAQLSANRGRLASTCSRSPPGSRSPAPSSWLSASPTCRWQSGSNTGGTWPVPPRSFARSSTCMPPTSCWSYSDLPLSRCCSPPIWQAAGRSAAF